MWIFRNQCSKFNYFSAYFSVVVGWCFYYFYVACAWPELPSTEPESKRIFENFIVSRPSCSLWNISARRYIHINVLPLFRVPTGHWDCTPSIYSSVESLSSRVWRELRSPIAAWFPFNSSSLFPPSTGPCLASMPMWALNLCSHPIGVSW